MALFDLAQRVKRGVRLLDKKVPGWRKVLYRHRDSFDLSDGACCVLGTLEHHSARMKALHRSRVKGMDGADYAWAVRRLNLEFGRIYGFDVEGPFTFESERKQQYADLNDLWRAEFEEAE